MPDITRITDHYLEMVDRLPVQFQDKTNIDLMIQTYAKQIQEIEDLFWEILDETKFHEARGVNLDHYGLLLGKPRPAGMDDNDYFVEVAGEIIARASDGTVNSIRKVTEAVNRIYSSDIIEINNTINWRNNSVPYLTGDVMVYGYYNISARTLSGNEGDLLLKACPITTRTAIYGEHIQLSDSINNLFIPCEIEVTPDDLQVYTDFDTTVADLVTDVAGTDNIAVSGTTFASYGKNWELAILPEDDQSGDILSVNDGNQFQDFLVDTDDEGQTNFFVQTAGVNTDHGVMLEISTSTRA